MGTGVEIRVLGPVEGVKKGQFVPIGAPQQRAVLAALAVDVGMAVSVPRLIDRVWGEVPPASARDSIHVYIARLRQVMSSALEGRVRISRQSGGYQLDSEPDVLDRQRFQELSRAAGEPGCTALRRSQLLRSALELWRGEPLANVSGSWVLGLRETWQQDRLGVVVAWARAELDVGNAAATIGPLMAVAADFPLVEPVAAAVLRALHAAGYTARALEEYAAIRERLANELGIDPSPELQEIHRTMLRGGLGSRVPPLRVGPGGGGATGPSGSRQLGRPADRIANGREGAS